MHASGVPDEQAVRAAGGVVLPDSRGISLHGWQVESKKAPIAKDERAEQLKKELKAQNLPEQLFADSYLRLRHEASGTVLEFTAWEALQQWQAQPEETVRVGNASIWLKAREQDVKTHNAVTLEYECPSNNERFAGHTQRPTRAAYEQMPPMKQAPQPVVRRLMRTGRQWTETREQSDKALLMSRDPILFYDEIPLYLSELDDNGASEMSVKVRVMPRCWYVLLRFWLRVDGVLVRLRETRLFCSLVSPAQSAVVLRETKRVEGTLEELQRAGAPSSKMAYSDADAASTALQAVAPIGLKLLRFDKLDLST